MAVMMEEMTGETMEVMTVGMMVETTEETAEMMVETMVETEVTEAAMVVMEEMGVEGTGATGAVMGAREVTVGLETGPRLPPRAGFCRSGPTGCKAERDRLEAGC